MAVSTTVFIGAGAQSANENNVYQIVPATLTFGHFTCASQKPTGGGSAATFTLRQSTAAGGNFGAATTIATCTVVTGAVSGSTSGTVSLTAGDVYDVQVTTSGLTAAAGVTAALGP